MHLLSRLKPVLHRHRKHSPRTSRHARHRSQEGSSRLRWIAGFGVIVVLLGLFFWFSSARIVGEPLDLSYGPTNPVFVDSMGPLVGAEFTAGNKLKLLANGDAFFPDMLDAISHAQKSVTLETYIWSSGTISDRFISALSERARAGVKVHVLVDGMGTLKLHDSDQKRMLDAGIEFVDYGREHWWEIKPNINHRTHRKLLIVDGKIGYTGGMCIDDRWLGNARRFDHWRDTQIRVEGPAVRQMQAVFTANWLQTTSRLLVGPEYFPAIPGGEGGIADCYKSGPNEDPENARVAYLMAIAAARHSIKILHAYFVPDDLVTRMLIDARARGVAIEVIVPSHNDSRFGRAASRSRWGSLLAAGVKFHLYEPAMYHCKMMIVDDVFVTIGSVNFDNRSFSLNDEVNMNVVDSTLARQALAEFDSDRKHSRPLTLEEFRDRPAWQKLLDHFCGLFRSQL